MNNEEAKFILKAYRPNGADAGDARFCAALAQAERDPELRSWFEREQAQDKAVATKLKSIPVPPGLRDAILTGGRLSAARRVWWQQPAWLGLAASVAILCTVFLSWPRAADATTDWTQVTAQLSADATQVDRHGSHGEMVRQFVEKLASQTTRLSQPMSIDLGRLKADGCRTLKIDGHEIMEVCFERNGGEFHLYVMRKPDPRDVPAGPRFAANGNVHSVLWTDPNHLYVMTSTQNEAALKALL